MIRKYHFFILLENYRKGKNFMHETSTLTDKLKLFTVILFPILMTQVSMYLMNFFDTVMSGRAGAADLAGVAIGSSLWVPIFTGINGVLIAITPIIAQLIGAKANEDIPKKVQQGIYLRSEERRVGKKDRD